MSYKGYVVKDGKKQQIVITNDTDTIIFQVGKKCVKDSRELYTGVAGTARWLGSIPAKPAISRPRSLSGVAFIAEVGRLIGKDRANELLEEVGLVINKRLVSANGAYAR